jgi:hypothetical protein
VKFTTSDLKQDRQWRATVGMSEKQFFILLDTFKELYFETYKAKLPDRKVDVDIEYCIENEEELLLFTLFSFKSGLTYDVLGIVCGMNGSNAKRNQKIGLEVLFKTLTNLNVMPKRNLLTVKEFEELFQNEKDLIIDATEQRIQRPGDNEKQKDTYSGKKNPIL